MRKELCVESIEFGVPLDTPKLERRLLTPGSAAQRGWARETDVGILDSQVGREPREGARPSNECMGNPKGSDLRTKSHGESPRRRQRRNGWEVWAREIGV